METLFFASLTCVATSGSFLIGIWLWKKWENYRHPFQGILQTIPQETFTTSSTPTPNLTAESISRAMDLIHRNRTIPTSLLSQEVRVISSPMTMTKQVQLYDGGEWHTITNEDLVGNITERREYSDSNPPEEIAEAQRILDLTPRQRLGEERDIAMRTGSFTRAHQLELILRQVDENMRRTFDSTLHPTFTNNTSITTSSITEPDPSDDSSNPAGYFTTWGESPEFDVIRRSNKDDDEFWANEVGPDVE